MNITFITGNVNKVREAEAILKIQLKHHPLDLDELQGLDPYAISDHKVKQGWNAIGEPLFVMDQSIYIHCLNDFPGPLIKWFWEKVTLEKICEIANFYNDHKIYTETLVTYFNGHEVKHFTGRIDGTIPSEPRGEKGWGWDSIFIPDGQTLTYSEINPDDVLALRSHKIALEKFYEFIHHRN
jgi:XTP/dITP diphosphohydrolase